MRRDGYDRPSGLRPAILWLRRDLRLHDHPALPGRCAASDRARPAVRPRPAPADRPLRLAEPHVVPAGDAARPARRTCARSARDLVVRVGDPRDVVPALAREVGARDVVVSRDHAPYGRARDAAVAAALAPTAWPGSRGAAASSTSRRRARPGGGAVQRLLPVPPGLGPLERRPVLAAPPRTMPSLPAAWPSAPIPTLADLGLGDAPTADPARLPEPGETAARDVGCERWLDGRHRRVRRDARPARPTRRHVAPVRGPAPRPAVADRGRRARDGRRRGGRATDVRQRARLARVLRPRPVPPPGRRSTRSMRRVRRPAWSDDDGGVRRRGARAGRATRSSTPAMRQLAATGWMHNRARMVTASFLTKDLLVDWRRGEAHFMRHLVDGDVASNNGGWQWSASTGHGPAALLPDLQPGPAGPPVRPRTAPTSGAGSRSSPTSRRARIHAPWEMTDAEQARGRLPDRHRLPGAHRRPRRRPAPGPSPSTRRRAGPRSHRRRPPGPRRPAGRRRPGRGAAGRRSRRKREACHGHSMQPSGVTVPSASGPPAWAHTACRAWIVSPMRTTTRSLMPAFIFRGVASGSVGEVGHVAGVELDPLRPGAAEGVAADHVAQHEDDVAADVRAGRQDEEADDRAARPATVRRRSPATSHGATSETRVSVRPTTMIVACERRPGPGRAVRVAVVGEPGHRGREQRHELARTRAQNAASGCPTRSSSTATSKPDRDVGDAPGGPDDRATSRSGSPGSGGSAGTGPTPSGG